MPETKKEEAAAPSQPTPDAARRPRRVIRREVLPPVKDDVPEVLGVVRRRLREFSTTYLKDEVSLSTNRGQQLFERTYERIDRKISDMVTIVSRHDARPGLNAFVQRLDKFFTQIDADLTATIVNCKDVLRKNGIADQTIGSDARREYATPVRTPWSVRYINLITKYDQLMGYLDAMWIHGIIDLNQRERDGKSWSRRFYGLRNEVDSLRNEASTLSTPTLTAAPAPQPPEPTPAAAAPEPQVEPTPGDPEPSAESGTKTTPQT